MGTVHVTVPASFAGSECPGPPGFTTARFSRDGRRLFVLRETGLALRWEVTPDALSRHACRVAGRDLTRAEWADLVPDEDYRHVCPWSSLARSSLSDTAPRRSA